MFESSQKRKAASPSMPTKPAGPFLATAAPVKSGGEVLLGLIPVPVGADPEGAPSLGKLGAVGYGGRNVVGK